MQDLSAGRAGRDVMNGDLDVPVARHAARTAGVGDRAHDERPGDRVDDGPFVLEPRPRAVVIQHDDLGYLSATFARAIGGAQRDAEQHGRCTPARATRAE